MLEYYKYKQLLELCKQNKTEEVRNMLVQMQNSYIDICDENSALKTRIEELEDILHMAKNLVVDKNCYWLMTGKIKQGPFCQDCYMREGALIRLEINENEWQCGFCGACYERPLHDKQKVAKPARKLAKIINFEK